MGHTHLCVIGLLLLLFLLLLLLLYFLLLLFHLPPSPSSLRIDSTLLYEYADRFLIGGPGRWLVNHVSPQVSPTVRFDLNLLVDIGMKNREREREKEREGGGEDQVQLCIIS